MASQTPDFHRVKEYWDSIDPTVSGVLGGLDGALPRIEEVHSRWLLLRLKPSLSTIVPPHKTSLPKPKTTKVLDAGAGIGRVTANSLLPLFDRVDMIETSAHFLDKAIENSVAWPGIADQSKGVRFWKCPMQDFDPLSPPSDCLYAIKGSESTGWDQMYDVIWLQWCVVHLTDDQFVAFLKRCKAALATDTPDGAYIVVKDNMARTEAIWDEEDHSIMRTDDQYKLIFAAAGLVVIKEELQFNLPKDVLPVKNYVLVEEQS